MRRPVLPAALAVTLAAVLVACGTSGRDLRQPVDGAVSPTRAVSTTIASVSGLTGTAVAPLTLTSPAFADGTPIPADNSCKGPSPALVWTGIPVGTKELDLVVVDESDGGFVHWLVTGIAPAPGTIVKGQPPPGAVQHANSAGSIGWYGPCPTGDAPHTYTFTLIALTQASGISNATPAKDAVQSLNELVQSTGSPEAILTGTFGGATSGTSPGSGVSPTLGPSSTRGSPR